MEANEEWIKLFPEAKVFHRSMAASDHCLLSLSFKVRGARRGFKKRFMFEEMWTRDERGMQRSNRKGLGSIEL